MSLQQQIDQFLTGSPHAVVGASPNRNKYGNKVLRSYLQTQRKVYPVHPSAEIIEGLQAYPDLASVPEPIHGVSIITPPVVTERIIQQAGELGIRHIWMQPGAENDRCMQLAEEWKMNVIAGGPCLLVVLRFRD